MPKPSQVPACQSRARTSTSIELEALEASTP